MQQKYRGWESRASHTSTAWGRATVCLWCWAFTAKALLISSWQNKTKPSTPPCRVPSAPEEPSPQAGMAQPLCDHSPGWPGHAACAPQVALRLWRGQAMLSLAGQVSSLPLVAGMFLYFKCAARLEEKISNFKTGGACCGGFWWAASARGCLW